MSLIRPRSADNAKAVPMRAAYRLCLPTFS